jgi:flagella basal body P-ring formation protein FlgA
MASVLIAPAAFASAAAPAGAWQDAARLEARVEAAALRDLAPLAIHQRLQVGPLPPQLQVEACDDSLRLAAAPGSKRRDREVIEVRCGAGTSWHLYVPVRVVGTSTVAVAVHSMVAGSVLSAADVRIEERDLTQLPPGYFNEAAAAVGLTVGRPISGGTILTNQQLLGSKAIQRGQTVTLLADAGGLRIRMAGRALSDALVNQRIRVENLSSGKVVEGIARSQEVVEIVLQ